MSNDLVGKIRFDTALGPYPIASAAETISSYYDMANYKKAIFIIEHSSFAGTYGTTGGIVLRRVQATSSTGANAIIAGSSAELAMGTTYTICSTDFKYVKASYAVLTCNTSISTGATVKINDHTYTLTGAVATSDFSANRYICSSSGPVVSEHLGAYINHADYGVPGVKAIVATNTVTLTADEKPISIELVSSNSSGGMYLSSVRGVGYLAIDCSELGVSSSYRYVAVGITPGSSANFAVTLLRTGARYSVTPANLHGDDNIAGS